MRFARFLGRRSRAVAMACAVAGATVGIAAVASAGPSAGSASAQVGTCSAGTTVQTSAGPICGVTTGNGVNEWLGVPFAAPPVGALRWAPPQPHAQWATTLEATSFANECLQPAGAKSGPAPPGSSEDCLYLNVYAPATGGSNLPVMFHIHGGGLFKGSGAGDYSLLAKTGEVIVSTNYRLGIFGFLADSAFGPHAGDYGLQDQQAALRWVQQNIAAFGGDPNHVTIFGESGGASSVCDQIASPTAKGLFEQAIDGSGEYNTLFGGPGVRPGGAYDLEPQDCKSDLPSESQAQSIGAAFAASVGCGSGTADVAGCLRGLSADAVLESSDTPGDGYQYGGQGTIAPTINGTTLTGTLRQGLRRGDVNRVPVMIGTERDENLVGEPTTASEYAQTVQDQYGRYAPQVLALYPLSRFETPFIAWRTVAADSDTVCPAIVTDQQLARWMPVYGFLMTDNDPPGYTPAGAPDTPAGAPHDNPWAAFEQPEATPLDADQQVLQDEEIAHLTTFARTGNPTAQGFPIWPEFNHSGQEMELAPAGDSQPMPISQISANHNCRFWDAISPGVGWEAHKRG
jgi:para-nitrobenzyl esterase